MRDKSAYTHSILKIAATTIRRHQSVEARSRSRRAGRPVIRLAVIPRRENESSWLLIFTDFPILATDIRARSNDLLRADGGFPVEIGLQGFRHGDGPVLPLIVFHD